MLRIHFWVRLLVLSLSACRSSPAFKEASLRLATTTSTYDSGLLDVILPAFEREHGAKVEVIAVGTGQALTLGERGDVDVVLVHAPSKEKAFVEAGHGVTRFQVMFNDFIIVGPPSDPARVRSASDAAAAFSQVANSRSPFASRGDQSGTYARETGVWEQSGLSPSPSDTWYYSLGQGMGETLNFASEKNAYTITDRGTFLALRQNLPNLTILFGGPTPADNPDPALRNFYSVIPVNPDKNTEIQADLALEFVEWLISVPTQAKIGEFGRAQYGQTLFFPNSDPWKASGQ
ncbi:MAG: substrate-binding domain-containing protein [Anaerolineales bacterium]